MLSVIVPVYNSEKYLSACINSILGQTLRELELILVDDGSTDKSPEICDAYAEKDERVKVLHKQNGGPGSAIKAGVLAAAGKYVAFVDSDDYIRPEAYEFLVNAITESGVDLVMSGYYEISDLKGIVYKPPFLQEGVYKDADFEDKIKPRIFDRKKLTTICNINFLRHNKLYRKDIILPNLQYIDERVVMWDDQVFNTPIYLDLKSLQIINKGFYEYRQVAGSVSSGFNYRLIEDAEKTNDFLNMIAKEKGVADDEKYTVRFARMRVVIINKLLNKMALFIPDKTQAQRLMKEQLDKEWVKEALIKAKSFGNRYNRMNLFFMRHRMVQFIYWYRKYQSKRGVKKIVKKTDVSGKTTKN